MHYNLTDPSFARLCTHYIDRRMTLKHMRILNAVDERKTVSGAAESLNMTTANVSKTIKEIEEFLGENLYYRKQGHYYPMPHLLPLTEVSRRVLAALDEAKSELSSLYRKTDQEIRIGYSGAMLEPYACLLGKRLLSYPISYSIKLINLGIEDANERMRQGNLDIILTAGATPYDCKWQKAPLRIKRLHLVVASQTATEKVELTDILIPSCSESTLELIMRQLLGSIDSEFKLSQFDSTMSLHIALSSPGSALVCNDLTLETIPAKEHCRILQTFAVNEIAFEVGWSESSLKDPKMRSIIEREIAQIERDALEPTESLG